MARQRTVIGADAKATAAEYRKVQGGSYRPLVEAAVAYSLEVQRWVRLVDLDLSIVPVGEGLNFSR